MPVHPKSFDERGGKGRRAVRAHESRDFSIDGRVRHSYVKRAESFQRFVVLVLPKPIAQRMLERHSAMRMHQRLDGGAVGRI
jgi:hypothetical protein